MEEKIPFFRQQILIEIKKNTRNATVMKTKGEMVQCNISRTSVSEGKKKAKNKK